MHAPRLPVTAVLQRNLSRVAERNNWETSSASLGILPARIKEFAYGAGQAATAICGASEVTGSVTAGARSFVAIQK